LQAKLKDLQSKLQITLPKIGASRAADVLVVPAGQMSIEDLSDATEDMMVMERILQTKLGTAPSTRSAGYTSGYGVYGNWMSMGLDARALQSVYLQGYGALFTMEVDYPLAPGPETQDETSEPENQSQEDPLWRQMQMEVLHSETAERRQAPSEEGPKYSAEKVEALRTNAVETLKHASNIRVLKSDDVVVVTITGIAPAHIESVTSALGSKDIIVAMNGTTQVYEGGLPENIALAVVPTALTLRAKVVDIKSYAAGDLNTEQFRDRVQILYHSQLGAGAARAVEPLFGGGSY